MADQGCAFGGSHCPDKTTDLVSKFLGFDGTPTSGLRDGRQIDIAPYSPIFYWVGWLVVAYFILYGLAYYVAPAIFGYTPGYYRPPFAKNYRKRRSVQENEGVDWDLSAFASDVMYKIDSFLKKYNEK